MDASLDAPPLLSVVVPVFNEAATVARVVDRVLAVPLDLEVVVVDDGSTDGTREVLAALARPRVRVLLHAANRGKGAALRTGFEAARGRFVVVQDADLEYDPDDLPRLLRPLREGRADAVFGSRFLRDRRRPTFHRTVNRVLTVLTNLVTGLRLTDMETCYKAVRRDLMASLVLREERFGFEPEVTAKLARRKARVHEVPVGYRPRSRADGKKIGWRDGARALWCLLRYGVLGR